MKISQISEKRPFNVSRVRIAHPYTYTDAKKPLKRLEYLKIKDIWKGIETNFWKYPSNYPSKSPLLPFHYFTSKNIFIDSNFLYIAQVFKSLPLHYFIFLKKQIV